VASEQLAVLSQVVALTEQEFDVQTANAAGVALQMLSGRDIDLLLADQAMRPMNGSELLEWVRRHSPRTMRLLGTDATNREQGRDAIDRGLAHTWVLLPLHAEGLLLGLRSAARRSLRERSHAPVLNHLLHRHRALQRAFLEQLRLLEQVAELHTWNESELEEDIRELRRQALELECQAMTDPLTGLLNRRSIEGVVKYELSRHSRYPGPLALGIVDADHFKKINDLYLQPGGDQALIGLAHALKDSLREADQIGRIGGEEFLVVAPQTDIAGASSLAERLRTTVEQAQLRYRDQPIVLTVSIGFAVAEAGRKVDGDELFHLASLALAEAKNTGRNRAVVRAFGTPTHEAS